MYQILIVHQSIFIHKIMIIWNNALIYFFSYLADQPTPTFFMLSYVITFVSQMIFIATNSLIYPYNSFIHFVIRSFIFPDFLVPSHHLLFYLLLLLFQYFIYYISVCVCVNKNKQFSSIFINLTEWVTDWLITRFWCTNTFIISTLFIIQFS